MRRFVFLLVAAACSSRAAAPQQQPQAPAAERATVEQFFGAPFPRAFAYVVAPSRAALVARVPVTTECWMIGHGAGDELVILDPAAWKRDACEHDPSDRAAFSRFIVHELVHTYHQQVNAFIDQADDDELQPLGWFIEGLATFASGQLAETKRKTAADAIRDGAAPTQLAEAWAGNYRYGVCGSLVQFIDVTWGRGKLRRLVRATSNAEILGELGVTEDELLQRWRAWVAPAPG